MKNLRVCHINTMQGGGAGIAALRLHDGLLSEGVESHFICAYAAEKHKNVHVVESLKRPKWKRLLRSARLYYSPAEKEHLKIQRAGGAYEIFSCPLSDFQPENHPLVQNADIIHLHWVANFINYPSFFSKVKKPIIWTLHDMNLFLGGFHYQGDSERNQHTVELQQLDRHYREIKRHSLKENAAINIVTPSKWLYSEAKRAKSTAGYSHFHVPNGLNTNLYRPFSKNIGRDIFNLPKEKKVMLFVSENVANIRKGFDLLIEALRDIKNESEFVVVAVGDFDYSSYRLDNLYTTGRIRDERLLALLYSAADAFIIPSREDNFPNVMLEALACGTPVIGFPIGGITDAINNGVNGFICEDVSAFALKEAIEKFLNFSEFDQKWIASESANKYALDIQAKKYLEIYNTLL